ncbi:MAG TPA: chitobiase/beta-hexosaminidase C-terminal domain-containing protein, partial [Chitinophagales bacterium]|nr:chitobiase/beta-hexosaminidase C-terminal domain-containing protein [Chitinophagales bacterium]
MQNLQKVLFLIIIFCLSKVSTIGQVVINEGSNKNGNTIADEDGDFESWIELYNAGAIDINIGDYGVSDDSSLLNKWTLPDYNLGAGQFLLLFTSGKNRKPDTDINHWEQPINSGSVWKYIIPNAFIPATWINTDFDDDTWSSGLCSVGYGDDDDNAVVPDATRSVYLRQSFTIADTALLGDALFSIDYDDGFIAYVNGNVIALNGFAAGSPAYNEFSSIDHEAAMYTGGNPEHFTIDEALIKSYLVEGENILAVEVHNVTAGSSDLTALPFLSFAVKDEMIIWTDVLPAWFPTTTLTANLHTNFKINAEGEKIYLSNPDGISIDTLLVNVEFADHSIGCTTDGVATNGIFMVATPGASNSGAFYEGYTDGVATFTLDAGFYTGSQITSINVPPGTAVHYTLNGEIPTLADPLYTTPITIDETQVIKARVFDLAGELLPGQISTNTFFIDESISVPVISISTNNDNLYGGFGIFDNWWNDWKKYAHVEYFDSLHVNAFEQAVGIKVDGGAGGSRSLPQKSMRVELDNAAFGDG